MSIDSIFEEDLTTYESNKGLYYIFSGKDLIKENISFMDKEAKSLGALKIENKNRTGREWGCDYISPSKNLNSFYFVIPIGTAMEDGSEYTLYVKIRISDHAETEDIWHGDEDSGEYILRSKSTISYEHDDLQRLFGYEDSIYFNENDIQIYESLDQFEDYKALEYLFTSDYIPKFILDKSDIIDDYLYDIDESLLYSSDFWYNPREFLNDKQYDLFEEAKTYASMIICENKDEYAKRIEERDDAFSTYVEKYNEVVDFIDDVFKNIKYDIKEVIEDNLEEILEQNGLEDAYDVNITYK